MKRRAEYEKTVQLDFRTSDYFAELLRVTTIQEETGCEELLDKPEKIRNSIERLNVLKEMFTDELCLQGWRQY
jgi:hypothetical protein